APRWTSLPCFPILTSTLRPKTAPAPAPGWAFIGLCDKEHEAAMKHLKPMALALLLLLVLGSPLLASEADLAIPDLHAGKFFNGAVNAWWLLFWGALVITGTLGISLYLRTQIHALPAHRSMLNVAEIIFQTCKTYLIQQGKFLLMLFVLIAL